MKAWLTILLWLQLCPNTGACPLWKCMFPNCSQIELFLSIVWSILQLWQNMMSSWSAKSWDLWTSTVAGSSSFSLVSLKLLEQVDDAVLQWTTLQDQLELFSLFRSRQLCPSFSLWVIYAVQLTSLFNPGTPEMFRTVQWAIWSIFPSCYSALWSTLCTDGPSDGPSCSFPGVHRAGLLHNWIHRLPSVGHTAASVVQSQPPRTHTLHNSTVPVWQCSLQTSACWPSGCCAAGRMELCVPLAPAAAEIAKRQQHGPRSQSTVGRWAGDIGAIQVAIRGPRCIYSGCKRHWIWHPKALTTGSRLPNTYGSMDFSGHWCW